MEKVLQLALPLMIVIPLARFVPFLSRRWGMSTVALQLFTGILLGPSVFNLLGGPVVLGSWGSPGLNPAVNILKVLAEVGLIQLMFVAGLKADWSGMSSLLKPILSMGGWSFLLTAASVIFLSRFFVAAWAEALAVGAIVSGSSFGMTVYNLQGIIMNRKTSALKAIEGASAFAGFLSVLLMVAALAASYESRYGGLNTLLAVSWFVGKLVMFFAIAYFLFSRFLTRGAATFEKRPRQMLIGYLLLLAALYAWASLHFGGFASAMASSLAGALLAASHWGAKERIAGGLESSTALIPAGIFFILAGMEVNLLKTGPQAFFLLLVLASAVAAKSVAGCRTIGHNDDVHHERTRLILGILPPGEMGLLVGAYLFSRGLVEPGVFNGIIAVVLMLTAFSAALINRTLLGERGQNPLNFGRG